MDCISNYMIYKIIPQKKKDRLFIYGQYIKNKKYFCYVYSENKHKLYMNRRTKMGDKKIMDIDFLEKHSNYMSVDTYYYIHYFLMKHC